MPEQCAAHSSLERWLERIEKKLDEIAVSIHGNGSPGLRERVRVLEEENKHNSITAARNENRALVALRMLGPYVLGAAACWIGWKQ